MIKIKQKHILRASLFCPSNLFSLLILRSLCDLRIQPNMAAKLQVPAAFQKSYDDFGTYPCNLIYHTSYPVALKAYQERLLDSSSKLLTSHTDAHVAFRDFTSNCNFSKSIFFYFFTNSLRCRETERVQRYRAQAMVGGSNAGKFASFQLDFNETRSEMPFRVSPLKITSVKYDD